MTKYVSNRMVFERVEFTLLLRGLSVIDQEDRFYGSQKKLSKIKEFYKSEKLIWVS